jgi:hypothetical protein
MRNRDERPFSRSRRILRRPLRISAAMSYANLWLRMNLELAELAAESANVVALRMVKLAAGGAAAAAESERMVLEKAHAAVEANAQVWTSLMTGQAQQGPTRALAVYRRKVRANRRRLSR